ncbi:MAG: hypothetical protein KDD46_05135 [Bdellovibrionales bacterium]|nr:hypothetical protein [Bdellovibrionales bacterium]
MRKIFFLCVTAFLFTACASNAEKAIEEARFLLDKGEFEQAIDKLDDIVDDDPTNLEATFLLATAYVGQAASEPRINCEEEDTGILGLLACFLREKTDDDRLGLATFARIAPATLTEVDNVRTGIDLLADIDLDDITRSNSFSEKDVYAQIAIARMLTLSTITTISEANTGDEADCNASLISSSEADDFRSDLAQVQEDLDNAGFPSNFALITRSRDILDAINNAGFTTPTIGVQTLVADAFSTYTPPCACATCEQAALDAYNP